MTALTRFRARHRRAADLPARLEALAEAVELADGRLNPAAVADAQAVLTRAGERMLYSAEHTVVALAGATGSGKSSLFNALAGLELAQVGVRRPTTAEAAACIWGSDGATELVEWLGIDFRHQVNRESALDEGAVSDLHGLVLLDLPDHDSTEVAHRLIVDRLVEQVDLLVWVMDPQKYADGAIHQRYLRRLSGHAGVMLVLLNQIDRLTPAAATECAVDLGKLLAQDGLGSTPLIETSAVTGAGLDELRRVLVERVQRHETVVDRVAADVQAAAVGLLKASGSGHAAGVRSSDQDALVDALAEAAGVSVVAAAVERSHKMRSASATGWPFTRWGRRLRPDPLRRLRLDRVNSAAGENGETVGRTSLPAATPIARSQADTAIRRLADRAALGLPDRWVDRVRDAATVHSADLADSLDVAIARTDLELRRPLWWPVLGALQVLLAVAAVLGLLWLTALAAVGYLRLPDVPTPDVGRVPVPALLLIGGVLAGLVVAGVGRLVARVSAARRRRRAEARMRAEVAKVTDRLVVAPVRAEIEAFDELGARLQRARTA